MAFLKLQLNTPVQVTLLTIPSAPTQTNYGPKWEYEVMTEREQMTFQCSDYVNDKLKFYAKNSQVILCKQQKGAKQFINVEDVDYGDEMYTKNAPKTTQSPIAPSYVMTDKDHSIIRQTAYKCACTLVANFTDPNVKTLDEAIKKVDELVVHIETKMKQAPTSTQPF